MNRPRITVAGLAVLVLVFAVGVAALRGESRLWAGTLLLLDLALLAFAILAVVYREGARRAWWVGFALFGWGYLAIAFGPWAAEFLAPKLVTSMAFNPIYETFGPFRGGWQYDLRTAAESLASGDRPSATNLADAGFERRHEMSPEERALLYDLRDVLHPEERAILEAERVSPPRDYRFIRASRESFQQSGHCLIALLAACLGGIVARVLHNSREMQPW